MDFRNNPYKLIKINRMNWLGIKNIPNKLITICLVIIISILLLAFGGFLAHELMFYRANLKSEYSREAKLIGQVCSKALLDEDVIFAHKFLSGLEANPDIVAVCIYDRNGYGFANYLRKDTYNFDFPKLQLEGIWVNGNYVEVYRRISSGGEFIGTVYLKAEVESFSERIWKYAGVLLVIMLLSVLASVVLAYLIYSSITKPVSYISEIAQKVAKEKDFSIRVKKTSEDEIGRLVDSFNWMLEQIKQREEDLKNIQKELEKRVSERTEELVRTNEKLKSEIVERRKAEESLRNSQQKLLLHIQQTPLGVIDWTLDQRAINWNPAAEKVFGYRESEVIGKRATELIIPEVSSDDFNKFWQLLLNREGGNHAVIKNKTKSGKIITCEWFNTLLTDYEGKPIGVVSLVLDITSEIEAQIELRKYEEQTRKAEKMHAIGQLAAGIAHDFNNILTIIQGHVGMLLTTPHMDASARETLKIIFDASAHAANIVKQLLTFSRKTEFKPALADLNQIVSCFYNLIERSLGKNINTKLELFGEPLPINCDATLIQQAILNLSINAKDAMPEGGVLTIRTERARIKEGMECKNPEAKAGTFAILIVSDTGIGMDESVKKRIFEPFFTSKEPGKGTGLGLAMVYGIVKQHNGWIEVESEQGRGTTFKIYLPLEETRIPASREESLLKSPLEELYGTETVLVVEDEPSLRDMVCGILKHYGYKVASAADGVEALKLCEDSTIRFDLLLSDMLLPEGISGRELGKKLKERYPDLKIIITSGYSADPVINRFEFRDGFVFLPKPYNPLTLLRTVRHILDEGNARHEEKNTKHSLPSQLVEH